MIRFRPLALLCALVVAPNLVSQQTIIVDVNNGPGTDFTDLQLGIDAAVAGDTVLVRPGPPDTQYPVALTTRGIAILGVGPTRPVLMGLTVRGVPSSESFVLSGVDFTTLDSDRLLIEDCDGPVHIDRVSDHAPSFFGMNFRIVRCPAVTMTEIDGLNTIAIDDSRVAATNMVATASAIIPPVVPTVRLVRSTLSLARSTVTGVALATLFCGAGTVTTAGVSLDQSELIFDRATTIDGGAITAILPVPMSCGNAPAFVGASGTVRGPTATGSAPGLTFVQEDVFPAASSYSPSGDFVVSVGAEGNPGALLFAGFAGAPLLAFPQGLLWLQPAQVIGLGFVAANAQGDCVVQLPVAASLPPGFAITWQFLVGTPTSIVLGEPAVSIVRS